MSSILDKDLVHLDLKVHDYNVIEGKQFDNMILHFILTDLGNPIDLTNYSVQLNIKRPDNTFIVQSDKITKTANGELTIVLNNNAINVYGEYMCDITLINSNAKQVSTFNFTLDISQSALDGLSSENEKIVITITEKLQEEINKVDNTCIKIEKTVQDAENIDTQLKNTINDSNTAKTNLENTISNANKSKTELQKIVDDSKKEIRTVYDDAKTELDSLTSNAQALSDKITEDINTVDSKSEDLTNLLDETDRVLPMPSEVEHSLMNIMSMGVIMEKELNKTYTGDYANIMLTGLLDDSKITLEDVTLNTSAHTIDLDVAVVSSLGFCYE